MMKKVGSGKEITANNQIFQSKKSNVQWAGCPIKLL